MTLARSIVLAVTEGGPAGPSNVGLGSVVLTIAIAVLLAWVGYLIIASRRRRKVEETPANLQPGVSDDELETNRVTRVLGAAVVSAAVLAIALPVYYIDESNRQARAAEAFVELDIEEGARWWEEFSCTQCHGPAAGGGGATFVERRSGLDVTWTAPSLNDVYFRFDREEIQTIIVFGRQGTPMPSNGLEGGGAMTEQEVDQVMAWIESIQITQGEALEKIEGTVGIALGRIIGGSSSIESILLERNAALDDVNDAPRILTSHQAFLARTSGLASDVALDVAIEVLVTEDGTCTDESAAMAGTTCGEPGADVDRDGIADAAEPLLTQIAAEAYDTLTSRLVQAMVDDEGATSEEVVITRNESYNVTFDPTNAFSNSDVTGTAIADMDELASLMSNLASDILATTVIEERIDTFTAGIESGIAFLEEALAGERWIPQGVTLGPVTRSDGTTGLAADYTAVAARMGDPYTSVDAERAVGLFNGYCARCHTGGYQAGVATEQEPGSGAWGPSLRNGRAIAQFPDAQDHMAFVIKGTEFGVNYGVNGLGSGRMPGFGQILSLEDIELIVAYERSL